MHWGSIKMHNEKYNYHISAAISCKDHFVGIYINKEWNESYIDLYFACQKSGNKKIPISLPITNPFYLLPYGSRDCQQVKWMVATTEWIKYHTQNYNGYHYYQMDGIVPHHDIGENSSNRGNTMFYCYYESCNYTLTNTTGVFLSPGFPGKYPDGQLCSWRIMVPVNHTLIVNFKNFSLYEYDEDCLQLYENSSKIFKRKQAFFGHQAPFTITATRDVMFVFRSDEENNSTGFRANYTMFKTPGCNHTLTNSSGVFQSPGFPGKYPNGQLCSWRIMVPDNHTLRVRFTHFSLNENDSLRYSKRINGSFRSRHAISLNTTVPFTLSANSDVRFVFRSDESDTGSGFRAKYRVFIQQAAITPTETPTMSTATPPMVFTIFWSASSAITPSFEIKSINTTWAVLELINNENSTFQVIIQKIDHGSKTAEMKLPTNISSAKNRLDLPRFYITAQMRGNKVTIGDGQNYGGYNNIPLEAGSIYIVYLRVVQKDNKGNMVYSEPRNKYLYTKSKQNQLRAASTGQTLTQSKGTKASKWDWNKPLPIIVISVAVFVLTIIIVTVVVSLRITRKKAKKKRDKAMTDKDMYMTIDDAIELKKLEDMNTLKSSKKACDSREERTYATLGGTRQRPIPKDGEKDYASLDETTRVPREPDAPKPPTSLYESLNNLNTSTTGEYESLDKVKDEASALSSILKSI